MQILNLSTYDYGGAGRAAYRLHHNFLSAGLDSRMIVLNKRSSDPSVIGLSGQDLVFKVKNSIGRALFRVCTAQNYYFQQQSRFRVQGVVADLIESGFKPDIIVAHWISNFLTAEDLFQLHKMVGAPVVWYLMDMAPLTGGCHYAWDCAGYTDKCGKCPALYSFYKNDLSRRNWKKKSEAVKDIDMTVVAATGWLYQQAKKATVFAGKRMEKIMLAVDPGIFKPVSKEIARAKLNLPMDKKIIFIASHSLAIERKGTKYFLEALGFMASHNCLDNEQVVVAIAGNDTKVENLVSNIFQCKHLGFLKDDEMLASAYQASDLFVCPSIEDSGPMMINESVLCGTPVVSFEMGVAPDLVHSDKTGYRAALKDSEDLAKGIRRVLDQNPKESEKMSEQCRALGMKLCQPEIQVDTFKELFNSIITKK